MIEVRPYKWKTSLGIYKEFHMYMSNPLRADIMNRKPRLAWELYLKMETSAESFSLLQLIANDCYKVRVGTKLQIQTQLKYTSP